MRNESLIMLICLDVGNTQIFGGVYEKDQLLLTFRYATTRGTSSDQLGVFLKSVLRENNIAPEKIKKIAICSVVPSMDYSLRSACIKYFDMEPFLLQPGVKTGLNIKTKNPQEVGADQIANSIAAVERYPNTNLIIVDYGTATTFCAINANKEFLGSVILAGIRISMDALQSNAAKLFPVEILKPNVALGRNTVEALQSGLYYGQLGIARELVGRIKEEVFTNKNPTKVIATGGFSHLFEAENFYDAIIPDLVLLGLLQANKLNFAPSAV